MEHSEVHTDLIHFSYIMIREAREGDSDEICKIYNFYIKNSICTFEETPRKPESFVEAMKKPVSKWIVYEDQNASVKGFSYLDVFKERSGYRFTRAISVYIDKDCHGQGIGAMLMSRLKEIAKDDGIKTLIGMISLPNPASVCLHEKFGFKKVGHLHKVGFKFRKWIDIGYWQLIFDY